MKNITFKTITNIFLQFIFVTSNSAQESKNAIFKIKGYDVNSDKFATTFQVKSEEDRNLRLILIQMEIF